MVQKRKIPQRKCVVTNEMKPKMDLIRIVRNKDGEVFVDTTGKKNGRGAYISRDMDVITKAENKNVLSQQLNAAIDPSIYESLKKLVTGNQNEK